MQLLDDFDDLKRKRDSAFVRLKPICIEASQLPVSSPDLNRAFESLNKTLRELTIDDDNFMLGPGLADYVFFPISHLLQRSKNQLGDRTTELILCILEKLISKGWGGSISPVLAEQLLLLIVFFISNLPTPSSSSQGGNHKRTISDETKNAGCKALYTLFTQVEACCPEFYESMIQVKKLPSLGHLLFVLLEIARDCNDSELQINAIKMVILLYDRVITDGDIAASFLPGTISNMSKIMSTKGRQRVHYKVLCLAIKVMQVSITRCMTDYELQSLNLNSENPSENQPDRRFRTQAWLKATKEQIKVSMNVVLRLRSHSHPQVRLEIAHFCKDLIENCEHSLDVCLTIMVETIAGLHSDSDPNISEYCYTNLLAVVIQRNSVQHILTDLLSKWTNSIPMAASFVTEEPRIRIFNCCKLAVSLLSSVRGIYEISNGSNTVSPSALWNPIIEAVSSLPLFSKDIVTSTSAKGSLELNISQVARGTLISGEHEIPPFPDVGLNKTLGLSSKNALASMLQDMARLNGFPTIQIQNDLLLTVMESRGLEARNSLWMAIQLFKGLADQSVSLSSDSLVESTDISSQISSASTEILYVCNGILEEWTYGSSSTTDNIMVCLALEGLSSVAEAVKKEIKAEFVSCLYPVVNLLASPDAVVRAHSQTAIINLAICAGFSSVGDLITENIDYLIDAVSVKLEMFDFSPQGPSVLSVIVRIAGAKALPYIDDVIATIFSVLDNFHGYSRIVEGMFTVLHTIVDQTVQSYQSDIKLLHDINNSKSNSAEKKVAHQISSIDELLEDIKPRQLAPERRDEILSAPPKIESDSEDTGLQGGGDDDSNMASSEEEKWELPISKKEYETIEKIATYTEYYLTHASSLLRMQLLQLLGTSIGLLAVSKKEFLPFVNTIWPVLVNRLQDPEVHVVQKTLQVIGKICITSGDFVSSRVRDTLPRILQYVPGQPPKTKEGKFSDKVRLLESAISCLCDILNNVTIGDTTYLKIFYATNKYIASYDNLRQALELINGDMVWLEIQKQTYQDDPKSYQYPEAPPNAVIDGVESKFVSVQF